MANLVHLVLERDGHDQPWGFRLQGGADVGLPLSVQRVLVGTPSEGTLFKGDVIQKVSYTDTKGLSHQQAADLFDNAGNQIHVYVKRAGVVVAPAAAAPLVNGGVKPAPVASAPPVSGGVALPGIAAPAATVNCDLPDSTTPTPAMSIQSQPHKYNPELGVGSVQHLKMQDDHITGVKEPSNTPSQAEVAKQKANELLMKEKVTGSLQQISQTQQTLQGVLPKGVVNKQYNTPLGLYSNDTIQDEVTKQANKFPELPAVAPQPQGQFPAINPVTRLAGLPAALPGRTLPGVRAAAPAAATQANPVTKKTIQSQIQRPQPVILTPNKEYNPQESATWKLLQEVEPKSEMQEEKVATFSSLKEHDPIYSEVYQNPTIKIPEPGQRPPVRNDIQKAKSPVADFLPFNKKQNDAPPSRLNNDTVDSPVRVAALSESAPINHQMTQEPVKIPVYEAQDHNDYYLREVPTEPRIPGRKKKTNSIGGRKKIAQSMSFNKLMMDVLGDNEDD